jgi:hypothetical protein
MLCSLDIGTLLLIKEHLSGCTSLHNQTTKCNANERYIGSHPWI